MQVKDLKVKIINHFMSANDIDRDLGLGWYERAHNECMIISQVMGVPLSKVIGVLTALSPNNKWSRNLHDTWNFIEEPSLDTKVCTFMGQRRKALNILKCNGEDGSIRGILKGPKTKNFYHNIKYYKTSTDVTVDRWAFRSVDVVVATKNISIVEQAYKEAAIELDLRPNQVQAVVWGVVRGKLA